MSTRGFPVAALSVFLALGSGCTTAHRANGPIQVVIVHGTALGQPSKTDAKVFPWTSEDSSFRRALEQAAGSNCACMSFYWDGANTHEARLRGGRELADVIKSIHDDSKAHVFVVGHSYGGNVALVAVNHLQPESVEGVFLLGTPHISVASPTAVPCPTAFELGEGATGKCGGEREHWLYWGKAPLRVSSGIWNLYSPQDSVQSTLASLTPGIPLAGTPFSAVAAHHLYDGPYKDRVRSFPINWALAPEDARSLAKAFRLGIDAHFAMHSSAVGRLIGAAIAGQTDPSGLLRNAALTSGANVILDVGQ